LSVRTRSIPTADDPSLRGTKDIPVTAVIPVKNEEQNLGRCLAAVSRFAEVIVVDSGSTDGTQEIARQAGARLI
jgi:glycosyltransferase involved in cell wall biosynthesis